MDVVARTVAAAVVAVVDAVARVRTPGVAVAVAPAPRIGPKGRAQRVRADVAVRRPAQEAEVPRAVPTGPGVGRKADRNVALAGRKGAVAEGVAVGRAEEDVAVGVAVQETGAVVEGVAVQERLVAVQGGVEEGLVIAARAESEPHREVHGELGGGGSGGDEPRGGKEECGRGDCNPGSVSVSSHLDRLPLLRCVTCAMRDQRVRERKRGSVDAHAVPPANSPHSRALRRSSRSLPSPVRDAVANRGDTGQPRGHWP